MKTIILIIGFILGMAFSYFAVSAIYTTFYEISWPPKFIEILFALFIVAVSASILYYSARSQQQRIFVFAIAGAIFIIYGFSQISVSKPSIEDLQPVAEQMSGSTTDNLSNFDNIFERIRLFGWSSIALGTLYIFTAFVIFFLPRRKTKNQKMISTEP